MAPGRPAPAVWFLMALFYGVLAVTRRSWKCAALAVLTANLGLWVSLELVAIRLPA